MKSQLFTLRVWGEEMDNGRIEIRGSIKHILIGEITHFRDWATLTQIIESYLTIAQTEKTGGAS
jgi:hypothetical protein